MDGTNSLKCTRCQNGSLGLSEWRLFGSTCESCQTLKQEKKFEYLLECLLLSVMIPFSFLKCENMFPLSV